MKQRLRQVARLLLGRDRNPLLRHIDRLEAAILTGLVAGFVLAAPLVSIFAGRLADSTGLREQRAEQAWRRVPAVLEQNAAAGLIGLDGAWDTSWVRARWPAPAGGSRTGLIATPLNARKGEVATIWVTQAGQLTHPPLSQAELRGRIAFAVLVTVGGLAGLLLLLAAALRAMISRRRMAAWERAWEATGPKWSRLR